MDKFLLRFLFVYFILFKKILRFYIIRIFNTYKY